MRLEPLISHTGILMTFYLNNSRFAEFLCIANQLRDVNTICRRSWYIAAHVWKIYDFKIEIVPLIINFSTELTTVVKFEVFQKLVKDKQIHEARAFNFTYRYIDDVLSINNSRFAEFLMQEKLVYCCTCLENL
jgi:hypothetical protein